MESGGVWVDRAGDVMEVIGVLVVLVGAVVAVAPAVRTWRSAQEDAYRSYRQALGRGILLGLEFLVAADIIRTVSHVPTVRQVSVLGGIVVIRTFLSFTLEVELEGRWPWQNRRRRGARPTQDTNRVDVERPEANVH